MPYNSANGGAAALAYAEATFMGLPYRFGGDYPPLGTSDGTDCSGLFQNAYNHVGIILPRTTEAQCFVSQLPLASQYEPGDGLFFAGAPSDPPPGHVGMYVGVGAISADQHTFFANPRGAQVMFNAPYTGDPHGIRYDYIAGLAPVLFLTRPAMALPVPPPPPPPPLQEFTMAVITTDPNNKGKILLDPNTGNYYGFSNPGVEAYWIDVLKTQEVDPPSPAVFAHFHQNGTI